MPPRALVSDHVFRTLLEALLAGRYAPGEKLPTQRALAADLGITMGSLREALKRLEQMGLAQARQGDAMRVRDWRQHGGLDVIAHLLFRSGGLDPGAIPPRSAWWARLATHPITEPAAANTGATNVMSLRCVPPANGSLRIT